MANKHLNQFRSLLKKRQGDQIFKLLSKQRDSGQIRNYDEFKARLDALVTQLSGSKLTPSLKLYLNDPGDLVSTEQFNYMLDRTEDDLVAGFEECLNLDEIQIAHQAIVRDTVLKNLKYGISELESKLAFYEFLATDTRGFTSSIFSTFRESRDQRTTRVTEQNDVLFTDHRTGYPIYSQEDALVELIGERLTLANKLIEYVTVRKAEQIFDMEATQSELIAQAPSMDLENLLDDTKGTFWIQTLLFENFRTFVRTKIKLDLAGLKSVNFLEIHPALQIESLVERIDYVDFEGQVNTLLSPNLTINGPTVVRFDTINAQAIIVLFKTTTSRPVQFEYSDKENSLLDQSLLEPTEGYPAKLETISSDLEEVLSSIKIKDLIGLSSFTKSNFKGIEFTFGLDNLKIGFQSYREKSVYVSSPLKLADPKVVGLRVLETRPVASDIRLTPTYTETTYDTSDSNVFFGSIEYSLIKRDFDRFDKIVNTSIAPILPLDIDRVHHERLLMVERSSSTKLTNDIGYTRFFADATTSDVKVYRNGVLLPESDSGDGWIDVTSTDGQTPKSGIPMQLAIRILQPKSTDIYTVIYTPLKSTLVSLPSTLSIYDISGGANIVDLTGDAKVIHSYDQSLLLMNPLSSAVRSELYLQIIIRNDSQNKYISPSVEEYLFLAAEKSAERYQPFEEI